MPVTRSFIAIGRLLLVSALCSRAAWAQSAPVAHKNPLPGVDLPMPTPIILPSATGKHLVCVQWVPEGFQWRDKFDGKSLIRVAVVDLGKLAVVATRDLASAKLRFAAGGNELYVADNDELTVDVLSFEDLSRVRSAKLPRKVDDMLVVADKLLCSTDGGMRLDLPDLKPTEKWWRLHTGQLDKLFDPVFPVPGGWHLDGIFFDETLSRPRMLFNSPLKTVRGKPDYVSSSFERWNYFRQQHNSITGPMPNSWRELGRTLSSDYLAVVVAGAPAAPGPDEDISVELLVAWPGGHKAPIARTAAGSIPRKYARGEGNTWQVDWDRKALAAESPIASRLQDPFGPVSLEMVKRRVIAAADGRLSVWDIDPNFEQALRGPFRIEYDQTTILEEPQLPLESKYTVSGSERPEKVRLSERIVDNDQRGDLPSILNMIWGATGGDWKRALKGFQVESYEYAKRALGREPTGPVFHRSVNVIAQAESDGKKHVYAKRFIYLIEVPETVILEEFNRRSAAARAIQKRAQEEQERMVEAQRQEIEKRQHTIEEEVNRRNAAAKKTKEEAEQQRLQAERQQAEEEERRAEEEQIRAARLASQAQWVNMLRWSCLAISLLISLILAALCMKAFRPGASTGAVDAIESVVSGMDPSPEEHDRRSLAPTIAHGVVTFVTLGLTGWFVATEGRSPGWGFGVALLFVLSFLWLGTTVQTARWPANEMTGEIRASGWIGVVLTFVSACYFWLCFSDWRLTSTAWLILHLPVLVCLVGAPAAAPVVELPPAFPTVRYRNAATFRSTNGLTLTLGVLLMLNAVFDGLEVLSFPVELSLATDDLSTNAVSAGATLLLFMGLLGLVVFLATDVVFLCWVYAANRNARALGARGMEFTPAWSVGWFFIPGLNLFRPYQVMKEICRASDPDAGADNWRSAPVPGFFLLWWILWLLGNSLGHATLRLQLSSSQSIPFAAIVVAAVGSFVGMIAALLARAVVREIHGRQEAKVNRAITLQPSSVS